MTIDNAPPSRNPTDNDSLNGALRLVLTKFLQRTDDMLPAKVIAYDPVTNTAQIQPLISVVTTDNRIVQRAQVASVPVFQLSMGGFILRFPCNSGDLGWIKANDRDVSLFKQTGQASPPNTQRKHSFEDAIFLPQAAWSLVSIADEDADNAVLQNYSGSVKISLSQDSIVISAQSAVTVNAPTATINSPTGVTVNTPNATFTGDVTIDGTIDVQNTGSSSTPCQINGNVIATGDITAAGVSLEHHLHSGVTAGSADTGPPV